MKCNCWHTHRTAKLHKARYDSQCEREATRFFRRPGAYGDGDVYGRCVDHVSKSLERMVTRGEIEEVAKP